MARLFPSLFGDWRAVLLVAAVLCASSGRATAACGEHVTILDAEANNGVRPASHGGVSGPVSQPCHGPNCSGAPERHVPPPAPAPSGPQVKGVASQAEPSGPLAEQSCLLAGDRTSSRPLDAASSIFHPPRP